MTDKGAALPHCEGCWREAPAEVLIPVQSVIDFHTRLMCPACLDNHAESIEAITRIVRQDIPGSWLVIPADIRDKVTVYDIDEYVSPRDWAERMASRQLVPTEPPEPDRPEDGEDSLHGIMDRIRAIELPHHTRRRRNWFELIFGWLDWRTA